jgi:hypothetical protein
MAETKAKRATRKPAGRVAKPAGVTPAQPAGVTGWLSRLQPREAETIGRLSFTPLTLAGGDGGPGISLAHEAITAGTLEVTEKEGGVVQELLATNKGPVPVAILEGDTLVGCKQNRVVAHSVLIAAGASAVIPVGCMQHGRWSWHGRHFGTGEMRVDAGFRREAVRETTAAKRRRERPRLDQGRLWDKVDSRLAIYGIESTSADYQEVMFQRSHAARKQVAQYKARPGDVGVMVTYDGRLVAIEVTGNPKLWTGLADRTLPSYAFIADDPQEIEQLERQSKDSAKGWLKRLARATVKLSPAIALGEDLEIAGDGLVGAGLQWSEQPIHVAVFANCVTVHAQV